MFWFVCGCFFFFKQKTAYEMRISDWSSDVCSSDLGVIGAALGTAILPALARHIGQGEDDAARRIQSNAIEIAMLITVPAAIALGICAVPLVTAFFRGGHFSLADATITGRVLACLVAGLPAYVLVKVLTPGFYARKDTKTPVKTAVRSEEHT